MVKRKRRRAICSEEDRRQPRKTLQDRNQLEKYPTMAAKMKRDPKTAEETNHDRGQKEKGYPKTAIQHYFTVGDYHKEVIRTSTVLNKKSNAFEEWKKIWNNLY
ncbi:hypothetical protein K1T71_010823 [Dendrolimus kikuchii]|uniref:Uncharacterized protein n=1 Tax=Dendrolimus kikuchii TaxID=765133 RepID=A0ACC1CPX7_9NEOP|nr:hypothetical protein K1T71_010823 [Dendrolimus kikuchii]